MAIRPPKFTPLADTQFSAVDLKAAEVALDGIKGGVERVASAALNRTLAKTKTQVVRGLTKFTTIKSVNLRRRIFTKKASRGSLYATLKIMGRPIGLINFKSRDTRKKPYDPDGQGVQFEVIRGRPEVEPDAFIATGKFKNRHVFIRKGKKRLPIRQEESQKLYDLVKKSPVPETLKTFIPADLKFQLDGQVKALATRTLKKKRL